VIAVAIGKGSDLSPWRTERSTVAEECVASEAVVRSGRSEACER